MIAQQHQQQGEKMIKKRRKRYGAKFAMPTGFIYRKVWDVDLDPILAEPSARRILATLGLDEFAAQPLPPLDRSLCDEFLKNFDPWNSSAMVRGERVVIDAASVSAATRLPIGDDGGEISTSAVLTKEERSALGAIVLDLKEYSSRGYSVDALVLGENVEAWKAICMMLMVKLVARRECFHCVPVEVLLALDRSYKLGIKMRWAEYLGKMIARGAKTSSRRKSTFAHGEWLTGIIKNKLGQQDQGRVEENHKLGQQDRAEKEKEHAGVLTDKMVIAEDVHSSIQRKQQCDASVQTMIQEESRDRVIIARQREDIRLLRSEVERGRAMVASLRDKYLKIKQEGITPPRKKIADHDQSMDSAPVAAAGSNSFREELIAPFDEDVEMEDAFPPPLPSSPPPPLPSSPPPDR
ncbi:hypothetical protein SELMODRAFT_404364 [Selaginella moellendorffii]|uniref:Uncharacterized protein n=2 Tax=Selaginella moellendorffii TaxID=88036 RepID=D8QV35_SELML|nr:hypothetical protein SELMODRAFT_404364 [Selaginella moellendorffii]